MNITQYIHAVINKIGKLDWSKAEGRKGGLLKDFKFKIDGVDVVLNTGYLISLRQAGAIYRLTVNCIGKDSRDNSYCIRLRLDNVVSNNSSANSQTIGYFYIPLSNYNNSEYLDKYLGKTHVYAR